ncbi:CKLF-like MARVEL transmembrane domain-containing protein 6 [Silurus meridionalis]|nr:CKLF-like MARVEL transmembrane domain-containing protein 6 [Silurus meridionalis]XP_046733570.1 CKLF-like MARVEL transmembrane domain-containing protein 6 [Silurus meridionalis]
MASPDAVYNTTTTTTPTAANKSNRWFIVPNPELSFTRFFVKVAEVLLAFVAFVLEEVVTSCTSCTALYFFEFVSCTAFLFTLLLLILLSTPLHQKVGINCWSQVDFGYSVLICLFLFIASAAFAGSNSGSEVEKATVGFGFLAAIVFLVDVLMFYKEKGIPFFCLNKAPAAGSTEPVPEVEKLNTNGTSGTN